MKMFRLTRDGKTLATYKAETLEPLPTDNVIRAVVDSIILRTVAESVGGKIAPCIIRGNISRYADGAMIVRPRTKAGRVCGSRDRILFFTLTPYWY